MNVDDRPMEVPKGYVLCCPECRWLPGGKATLGEVKAHFADDHDGVAVRMNLVVLCARCLGAMEVFATHGLNDFYECWTCRRSRTVARHLMPLKVDEATVGTLLSCPHGDPTCPCPDGLSCHYEGPDAWPSPTETQAARSARPSSRRVKVAATSVPSSSRLASQARRHGGRGA